VLLCAGFAPARAATILISNLDGASEGFNDPTPAAPLGGNPGVTLGQQRLNVVQYAADIWGSILPSTVTIWVDATFDPLACGATSGVLGSAGPKFLFYDFPGAPYAGTFYNAALADKLSGTDLGGAHDIVAQFNSDVDNPTCLGAASWYYGYDGNEGSNIELLPVVLHELGHGLGFYPGVTLSTGAFPGIPPRPTVFSKFLLDNSTGLHWDQMTDFQRAASAVNAGNVVWDGSGTTAQAPYVLRHRPLVKVNAPAGIVGEYTAVNAASGVPLSNPGVTAPVVQVLDGVGAPTDGCEALTNAAQVSGNIALVDRGSCSFTTKALNAQNAGAVGLIVVNDAAGLPPDPLSGSDAAVMIPMTGISQADGLTLKGQLANGLDATLHVHATDLSGADAAGRVRIHAPSSLAIGSSISHWDAVAYPNLLMEPALGSDLHDWVDLTRHAFRDLGWFTGSTITGVPGAVPVTIRLATAPNPFQASTTIRFSLSAPGTARLDVFGVDGRRVRRLVGEGLAAGPHQVVWDGLDEHGRRSVAGVYLVRLETPDQVATGRTVRLE
jgi:hypothetical protein